MSELIEPNESLLKPAGGRNPGLGLVVLAVVSSLLASTCCMLPLVLVLVGVTGAWMTHLTALRPIAPVFTVLALAALAAAAYLIFRPAQACAPAEAACATSRRSTKWIFFGSALFVGALLLFPLAAPYFY